MAVHKRQYRPYAGERTAAWERPLVLARYALSSLFGSRLVVAFLAGCWLVPLVAALIIYLHHNLDALALLKADPKSMVPIDNAFFLVLLNIQGTLAFLFAAYAGPGLVAPDLANNALPLYLCRPISRAGYVLGKMAVLLLPLSAITWVPGALLFGLQAGLAGGGWGWQNGRILWATVAGGLVWIVFLSLLALALSAWVRWRLVASASLAGIFFVLAGFSEAINEVLETKMGHLINLGYLLGTIWADLFGTRSRDSVWGALFDIYRTDVSPGTAWLMLALFSGLCVWLLEKRLRAKEIVS